MPVVVPLHFKGQKVCYSFSEGKIFLKKDKIPQMGLVQVPSCPDRKGMWWLAWGWGRQLPEGKGRDATGPQAGSGVAPGPACPKVQGSQGSLEGAVGAACHEGGQRCGVWEPWQVCTGGWCCEGWGWTGPVELWFLTLGTCGDNTLGPKVPWERCKGYGGAAGWPQGVPPC